jgi:ATP-binding cassette subfamily F protein 3
MVIVSHDREFLDQVCTKIVDAEGGICNEYDGNYSRFLDLKKARMDAWQASYDAQEKKMKEERAWINKFKVKQPQAVKQRKAKLEKQLASDDYVKRPPTFGKPFRFRFPDAPRLSPEVRAYCISLFHHSKCSFLQMKSLIFQSSIEYSHLLFRPPLVYILLS